MSIQTFEKAVIKTDIASLKENVDKAVEEVLSQVCDLIVGYAKIYVAVDTGSLRDSIRKERGGEGLGWRLFHVRAGGYIVNPKTKRLVDYAAYVEQHFPFLAPALAQVEPEIGSMLAGRLASQFDVNTSVSKGSVIVNMDIKANEQATSKLKQSIRNLEYILYRSIDIFRKMGLPEEFDAAIQKLTQILLILQAFTTMMNYLMLVTGPAGWFFFAMGFFAGTSGIIVTLDLLNNLG